MDGPQKSREENGGAGSAAPRRRGGYKFAPTLEQRRFVGLMAAGRLNYDEMSQVIVNPVTGKSIDRNTLAKHFGEELRSGRAKLKSLALSKLYERLLAGEQWAISFVLRHVNGFTEDNINVSIGGGPSAENEGIQISFVRPTRWGNPDAERVDGKLVLDHSEFKPRHQQGEKP
jgi:hypothetical protein